MLLHEKENNQETESFLKDNGEKFNNHCVEVLKLLYRGLKLSSRELETQYNMDGRRLRDIYAARKDCKREWKRDENGKRLYVQYYLNIPKPPTKTKLQQWFSEYQEEQRVKNYLQQSLF